jgi:hypothetical protein
VARDRDEPLNREQRRHPGQRRDLEDPALSPPDNPQSGNRELVTQKPQDTFDPRAKGSGHGKKTADKWNQ